MFADDTNHVALLCETVSDSKYAVYPASHFAQGFIRASGWYICHVQGILADVDEIARYSTYIRGVFHCIG